MSKSRANLGSVEVGCAGFGFFFWYPQVHHITIIYMYIHTHTLEVLCIDTYKCVYIYIYVCLFVSLARTHTLKIQDLHVAPKGIPYTFKTSGAIAVFGATG